MEIENLKGKDDTAEKEGYQKPLQGSSDSEDLDSGSDLSKTSHDGLDVVNGHKIDINKFQAEPIKEEAQSGESESHSDLGGVL